MTKNFTSFPMKTIRVDHFLAENLKIMSKIHKLSDAKFSKLCLSSRHGTHKNKEFSSKHLLVEWYQEAYH